MLPFKILFCLVTLGTFKIYAGDSSLTTQHQTSDTIVHLPEMTMKDVQDKTFESLELCRTSGMLLMVTVPNLEQHEKQKRWYKQILKAGWPQQNAPRCVIIQDMSQQETYRDKAVNMIADKAREDNRLTFIIDNSGDLRRAVGVEKNETVLFLIDKDGKIVHRETNEIEPDAESARRVLKVVRTTFGIPLANEK